MADEPDVHPRPAIRVLNCLHRSHPGGAHWRALWIGDCLRPLGIETVPLYPADGDDRFERHLTSHDVAFERVHLPGISRRPTETALFLLTLPRSILKIRQRIRDLGIDVVHVNGVTNLQPVLAALSAGTPVVWHFNDMQTPQWFVRAVTPLLKRRDVHLVVATEAILDHYGLRGILGGAWSYVPAPLSARRRPASKPLSLHDELGIPPEATVIGFVGNLHPVKGLHDFVSAMVSTLRTHPDWHAVIVGPDVPTQPEYAVRQRQVVEDAGIGDRTHFVGFQSDVISWLERFDVFAFPSYSEACPIVVLEAMEAGIPIAATQVGEVPKMLEATRLPLLPVGDPEQLREAVDEVARLNRDERNRLAQQLRTRVRTEYSLQRVTELHEAIYRRLVKG